MTELKNKIEAILFASGKGVTEEELVNYCDSTPYKIQKRLKQLQEEFLTRDGSLIISKLSGKWKMTVRGKYISDIEKIVSETELSGSVLKTLAIIAFKSPVLQSDIITIRGQGAYHHIKILVKEKFVTKEESGRSYLLKITDKFYNYFDVEGDQEIREVFEQLRKQQQKITEVEIIQMAKEQEKEKEKQSSFGSLEVVDIQPKVKERTPQEKHAEEEFLSDIDQKIDALSQRVQGQELPKREEENAESQEQSQADSEKKTDETSKEESFHHNQTTNKDDKKEEEDNNLEKLEEFADQQNKKSEEKEFL